MIMSPTRNNTIGDALTQESGGKVSDRAGISRGAQPGPGIAPNQVNPEVVSGSQAVSRSNATGTSRYEPAPTPVPVVLPQIQGNNIGTQGNLGKGARPRAKKQQLSKIWTLFPL